MTNHKKQSSEEAVREIRRRTRRVFLPKRRSALCSTDSEASSWTSSPRARSVDRLSAPNPRLRESRALRRSGARARAREPVSR